MSGGKKKQGGGNPKEGNFQSFNFNDVSQEVLKGLEDRFSNLIGKDSGYFDSLPQKVQDRVVVLKKQHEKKSELDKEFKKELAALEQKYNALFEPIYDQRLSIISGQVEPSAEEITAAKASLKAKEEAEGEKKEENKEEKKEEKKEDENVKGVPEFWLTVLKHSEDFEESITEQDEEALKFLKDIRAKKIDDGPSFSIEFSFESNPFFEDAVLVKTYHLVEKDGGPTMFDHASATKINWKSGKNLTVKKVTKTQGGKRGGGRGKRGGGAPKTVTVLEPCESFFNFFDPEAMLEDEDMEEEDLEGMLENDYEVGITLKEEIIPNAVLYFTGEIDAMGYGLGEDYEDDEDDDDEGHDDEEYNSEDDADFVPDPNAPAAAPPQNCNQQ